jgi:hypothetical protein
MPHPDSSRLSPRAVALSFALLFVTAAVPIFLCGILPLVDYPNHLARMGILAHLPHDATLARYYATAWRPLPNLAMDAIVPPLLGLLPLAQAGKTFVLLTFLLLAGGPVLLHRTLTGRWSAWPLLAFLFLYGRLLLWGILNYLFGLGLAFCALAGMVALARRSTVVRLAAGLVAALAIFFAHLMAFGIYAVMLLGFEASTVRRDVGAGLRRLAVAAAPLVVPLTILVFSGPGGGPILFSRPARKLDLLFSVFDLYHRPFDVACFALVVGAIGFAYWRRWLALAPALVLPLVLLAIAYLVMPTEIAGASGVDRRMPLALALTLCAGTSWIAPRPRLERYFLGAAALLFVVRLATVAASWHASDREYRPIVAALDALPIGARVAVAAPPEAVNVSATPLIHLPTLAAATRDAFVPTLFAIPGQQPIAFVPPWGALAAETSPPRLWQAYVEGGPPLTLAESAVLGRYDYVAFLGVAPFVLADRRGLQPVIVVPRFELYRLGG